MARLILAVAFGLLAGCATPPVAPDQPLEQTCGEVAKLFETSSELQSAEKREALEKLKSKVFRWTVRVLALTDETSRGELANGMSINVECLDRAGTTEAAGMRYVFTLNFDQRIPELAALSRGSKLTAEGSLTSYEVQGGFAAHVRAYSLKE